MNTLGGAPPPPGRRVFQTLKHAGREKIALNSQKICTGHRDHAHSAGFQTGLTGIVLPHSPDPCSAGPVKFPANWVYPGPGPAPTIQRPWPPQSSRTASQEVAVVAVFAEESGTPAPLGELRVEPLSAELGVEPAPEVEPGLVSPPVVDPWPEGGVEDP